MYVLCESHRDSGPFFSFKKKHLKCISYCTQCTVLLLKLLLCQTPGSSGALAPGETVPGEDALSSFRAKLGLEHRPW